MDFSKACEVFRQHKAPLFDDACDAVIDHVTRADGYLSIDEIAELAVAVADSGDKLQVPDDLFPLADTPSTGGPASLSTLLCPLLVASTGIHVPKLSATGSIAGGIDTMAIIPGFNPRIAGQDFIDALRKAGIAHAEPTAAFCPADRNLIARRRKTGLMPNPGLAAASLLAKKLAIPGTHASFDFRVGPTGNVGATNHEARVAKDLFEHVAARLGISIRITLTDNTSFPCTAVGRLESLDLLWRIISGADIAATVDQAHLQTCVEIAARACSLGDDALMDIAAKHRILTAIATGQVKKVLVAHLEAQGSNLRQFEAVLAVFARQEVLAVTSNENGPWIPPDLATTKNAVKAMQTAVQGGDKALTMDRQFGLRLLVSPGDVVCRGQPVLEIRYPRGFAGTCQTVVQALANPVIE